MTTHLSDLLAGFADVARQYPTCTALAASSAALLAVRSAGKSIAASGRREELRQRAARKRRERDDILSKIKLPEEGKDEDAIVRLSATQLLEKMESGELTSLQITVAFCRRALKLQTTLFCLAETNIEEAIALARKLDQERKEGKIRGPLHGLPVSIKDQIDMKGFDSTCGTSVRCFRPAKEDSLLVKILKDAGAIPFVRTNIPQSLFLPESVNDIWGAAKNPHDLSRTPGGSSGGEAALIAGMGSPLGIGTDIGGSIRGPSYFCGICGFKPTPARISHKGLSVPRLGDVDGQCAVKSVAGPMARRVEDLKLVLKVWCSERMWGVDTLVPPIRWDDSVCSSAKKLRFGYFTHDNYFDPCPAAIRAVKEAAEKLRKDGHEVVEFKYDFSEIAWSFVKLMSAEGGMRGFVEGLEGEALNPIYHFLYKTSKMPVMVRPLVSKIMETIGQPRIGRLVREARWRDTYDYWKAHGEMQLQKKDLIKKWEELKLDAMICPGGGVPAIPHTMSGKLAQGCSYTFIWNMLHFPAGIVTTTKVRADEQGYDSRHKDSISSAATIAQRNSEGLPMGVQVVSLPWKDELCVKAMSCVEETV